MQNLKYDTNEHIYKTKTDSQTYKTDQGGGGRGRMDWEWGISRCNLSYIEWINNKVLLYRTGDYIQSSVINRDGKEYEEECVYMYD